MTINDQERDKYNKAWSNAGYTGTDQVKFVQWCESIQDNFNDNCALVYDFGCGRAQIRRLLGNYQEYIGVDISRKAIELAAGTVEDLRSSFVICALNDMNGEGLFGHKGGTGICTDVLEHIHPNQMGDVLGSISDVVDTCYFSIALFDHTFDGDHMHLSVKSVTEWLKTLNVSFKDLKHFATHDERYLYVRATNEEVRG